MKKIFSLLLSMVMVVSSLQLTYAAPDVCEITGASLVVLPAYTDTDVMYVTDYALYSQNQKLQADFSVDGDPSNLFITKDGHLITTSRADAGQIVIKAVYEGRTYTKNVTAVKGNFIDFESETVGQKPSGWVNRSVEIASESDGTNINKYLDTLSTYGRYDFPSGDLKGESTTIEWDVKFTLSGTTVKPSTLITLTHNWANEQHSSGSYYYNILARHSNGKIELYRQLSSDGTALSWPYTAGVLGSVNAGEWVNMKLVLNHKEKEYSIYVNNQLKADKWKFESTLTDYATLVGMMPYGKVDNIKVYTGKPGSFEASAPSQNVMLPENGKTSSINLDMNLDIGGTQYQGITTSWQLKNSYTGVSVNGNVLTVTDDATPGDVVLVPEDDRFNCEKTVTINEPTIYLYTSDSNVTITAEPSADYKITLYHPKSQSGDLAEKFLEAFGQGDADAIVTSDAFTTDADGKYTYNAENLDAGIYNIYVEPNPNTTGEIATVSLYNRFSELICNSAAMESESFLELLIKENVAEASDSHSAYKKFEDKEFVIELMDGDINNFSAATAIAMIMEQDVDSAGVNNFAKSALEGAHYDVTPLEILSKNQNYIEVIAAVKSDGLTGINDILISIKENAILKGIKNALSIDEVKEFVAYLSIDKFNGARESQKDYMAGLLLNNDYTSTDDIENVITSADLSLVEIKYHIDGSSTLTLPAKAGIMSTLEYELIDTELDSSVDADFYISGDNVSGLYMSKDGTLITSSKALEGSIKINAVYQGKTYTKDVKILPGLYCDFESDTPGQKPVGWVDREVVVESDGVGNNYLNSLDTYARYNFSGDLASKSVTVEYDIKYTVSDNKLNTTYVLGFTHGWTNRAENKGRYYLGMSAALSSDKTSVEFSRGYNKNGVSSSAIVGSAPVNTWVNVKHIFDFEDKTYDIYINSVKAADGWMMDADITEATLVGIIPYGYTDNISVYSGDAGLFLAEAPIQSLALPREGKESRATLGLNLTVNGKVYSDVITEWTLKDPYNGVSVEGNILTVTDKAVSGTVYLEAKDGNVEVTKQVNLFEPTILLDTESSNLRITAKQNKNYNIYIYKNKGGNELIDNFITPTSYGDETADVEEILNITTNSQGIYTYPLSDLNAGIYNIYVMEADSETEIAHVQYLSKLSELFDNVSQVKSPKFVTFLTNQGVEYSIATKAQDIYKELNNKTDVFSLLNNDVKTFPVASSLCRVLELSSDNPDVRNFLAEELKKIGYETTALELLSKNAIYSDVVSVTVSSGVSDVKTVLDNLKSNSILKGIKNVANKRDAKAFLAHIGSSKYDSANNEQKNIIADAVAKNTYISINDVKKAVENVNLLSLPSGGSGGPGNISTGSGSSGGVGAPPIVKPITPAGTFADVANDFWAKDSIETLTKKGIISGYNGMFRPNDTLSRGEMAKIITVAAKLESGASDFADVSQNDWFYPYVGAAFGSGLINGYDGKFNPNSSITRQDVAVILYRLFGNKLESGDQKTFADSADISDYAKEAVVALSSAGIINGYEDGTFKPQSVITRAEVAHLMVNCITLWEGDSNE